MAATRAYAAAEELETLASAEQIPEARTAVATLERELALLENALGTPAAPQART